VAAVGEDILEPRRFYTKAGRMDEYGVWVSRMKTERRSFLERYNIRYLFYGPKERALGAFDPERAPYLSKCHQQGPHAVYRVIGERR